MNGEEGRQRVLRQLAAVTLWAIAFAFVEAAVVVYLRRLLYPGGFAFPLPPGAFDPILGVELVREAATLVMLVAVAWLCGPRGWVRFGGFMVAFGIWDIFYYVWLWVVLGWPPSLATLDVLFLLPTVWVGPVWAPLLVSACLVGWGAAAALRAGRGGRFALGPAGWVLSSAGALLIVAAFLWQGADVPVTGVARRFPWEVFFLGVILGQVAFVRAWRRGGA